MSRQSEKSTSPHSGLRDLTIIADDLTGACDAAVAFTDVASTVRVHIGSELPDSSPVTVLSTNSRDLPATAAELRLTELASRIPAGRTVFKKIDSVFRGNTFAEIAASIRVFPAEWAILAPAYPAMGRQLRDGVLQIASHATHESIPIAALLQQHGCAPRLLTASTDVDALSRDIPAALAAGAKLLVCDATEQEHLNSLVEAVLPLSSQPLWIGSGALAHALAAQCPKHERTLEPQLPRGNVIFFIGSDHPVTRGQQVRLERMSGIGPAKHGQPPHSRTVSIRRGAPDDEIVSSIKDLNREQIGCLFMTGGDTALRVCAALGITSLRLQREFVPGVPLCVAEGGRFDGLNVILKSGGFGERDLLCRILDSFAGKECVHAA